MGSARIAAVPKTLTASTGTLSTQSLLASSAAAPVAKAALDIESRQAAAGTPLTPEIPSLTPRPLSDIMVQTPPGFKSAAQISTLGASACNGAAVAANCKVPISGIELGDVVWQTRAAEKLAQEMVDALTEADFAAMQAKISQLHGEATNPAKVITEAPMSNCEHQSHLAHLGEERPSASPRDLNTETTASPAGSGCADVGVGEDSPLHNGECATPPLTQDEIASSRSAAVPEPASRAKMTPRAKAIGAPFDRPRKSVRTRIGCASLAPATAGRGKAVGVEDTRPQYSARSSKSDQQSQRSEVTFSPSQLPCGVGPEVAAGSSRHGGQPRQPQRMSGARRSPCQSSKSNPLGGIFRPSPRSTLRSTVSSEQGPALGAAATTNGTVHATCPDDTAPEVQVPSSETLQVEKPEIKAQAPKAMSRGRSAAVRPAPGIDGLRRSQLRSLGTSPGLSRRISPRVPARVTSRPLLASPRMSKPHDGALSRVAEECQGDHLTKPRHQEALASALCMMEDSVRVLYEHGPSGSVLRSSKAVAARGFSNRLSPLNADSAARAETREGTNDISGETHEQKAARVSSRDSSWDKSSEGEYTDESRSLGTDGSRSTSLAAVRDNGKRQKPVRWLSAVLVDGATPQQQQQAKVKRDLVPVAAPPPAAQPPVAAAADITTAQGDDMATTQCEVTAVHQVPDANARQTAGQPDDVMSRQLTDMTDATIDLSDDVCRMHQGRPAVAMVTEAQQPDAAAVDTATDLSNKVQHLLEVEGSFLLPPQFKSAAPGSFLLARA